MAAMTVGTTVLLWMEAAPARPLVPLPGLSAKGQGSDNLADPAVLKTDAPLQNVKWRQIIIHDVGREGLELAQACHFVIGSADNAADVAIRPTRLWQAQRDGHHIFVPGFSFNQSSIGICLMIDAGRAAPSQAMRRSLSSLVRLLQAQFQIPPDRVYFHSDLGEAGCPGRLFPEDSLRNELLTPSRR